MLYRFRTPVWLLWLFVGVVILLAVPPASAQEATDPYTVRDVEVDVTADNALAARDQAIAEAQREAFNRLFQRLTPDGSQQPPSLTNDELARLVQNFEVQRERTSAVRYVATLSVQFRPAAVRELMLNRGARFVEIRAKPLLVLPVYQAGNSAPVLWEDRTPWRRAWEDHPPPQGMVPVIVPFGDLADIADIGVNEALDANAQALTAIGTRYGAGEVAVARLAVPGDGPNPSDSARVNLIRYPIGGSPRTENVVIPAAPGQSVDAYLAGGVTAVINHIEESWKRANTVEGGPEQVMQVSVPIGEMEDWLQTRRRLSQVPTITRAQVLGLKRDGARLELRYRGNPERLGTALAQHDLELNRIAPPPPPIPSAPAPLLSPGQPGQVAMPAPVTGMGPSGTPATATPTAPAWDSGPAWQLRWAGASVPGMPALGSP